MPKAPTREIGTATLGITVAAKLRRNRNITMTTSATVRRSENWTSLTEARIVVVRSVSVETSTADGSEALSWGKSRLTRSTTVMMLAPGCRWMFMMTAGLVFIQAACLTFSTPSTTRATSESRTGAPFLYATTMALYSALVKSWSLAPMVNDWRAPSRLPFAWSTLACESTERRSSRLRPYDASALGSACTRTAGFWPPLMVTRPTPESWEIFWARAVSARSSTRLSGSVSEVKASVRTGVSAGLTLL